MQGRRGSEPTTRSGDSPGLAARLGRFTGGSERAALVLLIVLMLWGAALVIRKHSPARTDVAGTAWVEVFGCAFANGWCPAGWGWGDWEIADGLLRGQAPDQQVAAYFFCQRAALEPASHLQPAPVRSQPSGSIGNSEQPCAPFVHSGDFILETRVRLRSQPGFEYSEAQLLIRDGNQAKEGAGVTLRGGRESIGVLYQTGGHEHIYRWIPLGRPTEYDRWYQLRFVARGGRISAYVDGERAYDSGDAAQSGRRVLDSSSDFRTRYRVVEAEEGSYGDRLPPGTFAEPHLAVRGGMAEFEHVKLYVPKE